MKIVKASTKRGQRLLYSVYHCCWPSLSNLYKTWSQAKQAAYDSCWLMYTEDENAIDFGVGSANTFGFSASWLTTFNDEDVARLETPYNSYMIMLNK